MRRDEILKAIADFEATTNVVPTEVLVSIAVYAELYRELTPHTGTGPSWGFVTLNGVDVLHASGMSDYFVRVICQQCAINYPLQAALPIVTFGGYANVAVAQPLQSYSQGLALYGVDWGWGDKVSAKPQACECGSDKAGSPAHSSWCPKHGDSV